MPFNKYITTRNTKTHNHKFIHYTNNTIDFFYGEKFALEQPVDGTIAGRHSGIRLQLLETLGLVGD